MKKSKTIPLSGTSTSHCGPFVSTSWLIARVLTTTFAPLLPYYVCTFFSPSFPPASSFASFQDMTKLQPITTELIHAQPWPRGTSRQMQVIGGRRPVRMQPASHRKSNLECEMPCREHNFRERKDWRTPSALSFFSPLLSSLPIPGGRMSIFHTEDA